MSTVFQIPLIDLDANQCIKQNTMESEGLKMETVSIDWISNQTQCGSTHVYNIIIGNRTIGIIQLRPSKHVASQ